MQKNLSPSSTSVKLLLAVALLLLAALPLTVAGQGMMPDEVFVSIRLYDDINPEAMDAIRHHTEAGFLPHIRGSEGFIGYYWLPDGERLATINLFASAEAAAASNEAARDYVAAHLAPLLPNPPLLIEGTVRIGVVQALDAMAADASGPLHASLRLYEDFATDDLAAYVETVEEGFLPLMTGSDGFFGYYMLTNDAGQLAALSVFDSEASALASNEKARDFVAENLTQYLPNAPLILNGSVGIAALAEQRGGMNLIDNRRFISVRMYTGLDAARQDDIVAIVEDGFLPIMRGSDGFIGYFLLFADADMTAVSLFESPAQAAASNAAAADFVAENLASLLPEAPSVFEGPIGLRIYNALPASMDGGAPLYASLRRYAEYDLTHFDDANALAQQHLVPQLLALDGFFAQYTMHDNDSNVVAISVYTSEAAAAAANESAMAFSREHLMQWSPEPPTGFNASVRIASLARLNDGENLVSGMMAAG